MNIEHASYKISEVITFDNLESIGTIEIKHLISRTQLRSKLESMMTHVSTHPSKLQWIEMKKNSNIVSQSRIKMLKTKFSREKQKLQNRFPPNTTLIFRKDDCRYLPLIYMFTDKSIFPASSSMSRCALISNIRYNL